jgi:hypothetical protein
MGAVLVSIGDNGNASVGGVQGGRVATENFLSWDSGRVPIYRE